MRDPWRSQTPPSGNPLFCTLVICLLFFSSFLLSLSSYILVYQFHLLQVTCSLYFLKVGGYDHWSLLGVHLSIIIIEILSSSGLNFLIFQSTDYGNFLANESTLQVSVIDEKLRFKYWLWIDLIMALVFVTFRVSLLRL